MSVSSLIADAQSYAKTVTSDASAALDAARSSMESIGFTTVTPPSYTLPEPPRPGEAIKPPVLEPVDLVLPGDVSEPAELMPISPLDEGTAPSLKATAPTLRLPTAPSPLREFLEVAPTIDSNLQFPDPPGQLSTIINEPTFASRAEPSRPQTTLPTFTSVAPADTSVAPTNLQSTLQNAYAEAAPSMVAMANGYVDSMMAKYNPRYAEQMAAIESQLAKYLAGGTGLNTAVENAIYERSRGKQDAEARRARDSIYNEAAARGFTLPTGALASAIQ